jgi:hypothetical protein
MVTQTTHRARIPRLIARHVLVLEVCAKVESQLAVLVMTERRIVLLKSLGTQPVTGRMVSPNIHCLVWYKTLT